MNFLQVGFGVLFHVLREAVLHGFLEFVDAVASGVAYSHLGLFGLLGALLGELASALLGEGRNAEANDFAVVLGHDADGRVDDGLFDDAEHLLVPRLDGDGARIGCGDGSHVVDGDHGAV